MHIVYITGEHPSFNNKHGGVGSFIKTISTKLVNKNIKISIIGVYDVGEEKYLNENGVDIYALPKSKWKIGKFYENTKKILKKIDKINKFNNVDIVETAELGLAFFPNRTTYKKIIRMHGGHHFFSKTLGKKLNFWKAYQEKKSFNNADGFIAVSNFVGDKTMELLKLDKNFTTIYNFVNLEMFYKADLTKTEKNTILFVGTICEKKGIKQLVQAIPLVKKEIQGIKLRIVGRDWFFKNGSSYVKYLKTFIGKDIKNNIEILGVQQYDKIPKLIEKSEICIYPSHMESFGLTWLEALSMGKPVIGSKLGPGKELIKDNVTGILINPYKPRDIADKIIYLLRNKQKAKQMGEIARKEVYIKFDEGKIINENIQYYKDIK